MSDTSKVQEVREAMLEIYGKRCWMGYKLTRDNPFTYHHMHERRNGGKTTLSNGAILTLFAHKDLNRIELIKKSYYNALNELFRALNETGCPPTDEYYEEVDGILLKASKILTLSEYYKPNKEVKEEIIRKLERLDELDSNKKSKYNNGSEYEEKIYIPVQYSGKIKKKNRHKKEYKYR